MADINLTAIEILNKWYREEKIGIDNPKGKNLKLSYTNKPIMSTSI